MYKTPSETAMDQAVTNAIIEALGAMTGAFHGVTKLCESGAEYFDAKSRSRFVPPYQPPKMCGGSSPPNANLKKNTPPSKV